MQTESKTDAGTSVQGPRDLESAAESDGAAVPQTWDPYEVWLQRVRRPRDSSDALVSSERVRQRSRARS